jgi:hypothetical protein
VASTNTPAPLPSNDWDLTRAFPNEYADWKYEVTNNDTVQSFRTWLTTTLEVTREDEQ